MPKYQPGAELPRRIFLKRSLVLGTAGLATAALTGLGLRPASAHARPLITVTYGSGARAEFGEERLSDLPWQVLQTHTYWTEGPQTFRGPLLRDLLSAGNPGEGAHSALSGKTLSLRALNDFSVEIPADDAWKNHALLAREMNGAPMSVRDKGPLWLVYPRDQYPALQTPVIDERWVWQLNSITVI